MNELVVYNNNNAPLFPGYYRPTTFTVYVATRDLQKSFSFKKSVEIISHVALTCKHTVPNTCYMCS